MGGPARQPATARVAAVGRGVDAAAAAGRVRSDERTRRQPGLVAGPHAPACAGAHAGPLLDVLPQLHRERGAVDLGELVLHGEQAHTRCLAPRLADFAGRLVRLRVARFGHLGALDQGLGRLRPGGLRLGGHDLLHLLRRLLLRLHDGWRRLGRLLLQEQLREPRRQLLRLRAIDRRPRHQQHREADEHDDRQHPVQHAAKARVVVRRRGPRQHLRAERHHGAHVPSFRRTANATAAKFARALVYMTLRSSRYGMSLSPMIVTVLFCAWFSARITCRAASRSSSSLSGATRSPFDAIASATVATLRPSTRMSLSLTTTTMVSFGDLSAVDTGSFTAFGLACSATMSCGAPALRMCRPRPPMRSLTSSESDRITTSSCKLLAFSCSTPDDLAGSVRSSTARRVNTAVDSRNGTSTTIRLMKAVISRCAGSLRRRRTRMAYLAFAVEADDSAFSRCTKVTQLIFAASRPSTISLVLACRKEWISRNGIATISANAVLFIAIEIDADSISAFSAGLTSATAVNPSMRPMIVPTRPTSVITLA